MEIDSICPRYKEFMNNPNNPKQNECFLAAKMFDNFVELCFQSINKYEKQNKILIVNEEKDWEYVDVDKFFIDLGENF